MLLKNWYSIHARWSKSRLKHSIRFCGIFPSLKQNFIAYRSSKVSECIFEIPQLWQSDFSRVYSNCCCSCLFEPEIIRIGQSSHKMYSNNILIFSKVYENFKCLYKRFWKLIEGISYFLRQVSDGTHIIWMFWSISWYTWLNIQYIILF